MSTPKSRVCPHPRPVPWPQDISSSTPSACSAQACLKVCGDIGPMKRWHMKYRRQAFQICSFFPPKNLRAEIGARFGAFIPARRSFDLSPLICKLQERVFFILTVKHVTDVMFFFDKVHSVPSNMPPLPHCLPHRFIEDLDWLWLPDGERRLILMPFVPSLDSAFLSLDTRRKNHIPPPSLG